MLDLKKAARLALSRIDHFKFPIPDSQEDTEKAALQAIDSMVSQFQDLEYKADNMILCVKSTGKNFIVRVFTEEPGKFKLCKEAVNLLMHLQGKKYHKVTYNSMKMKRRRRK